MSLRPEPCDALAQLIRQCGESIVKMPSSCQIYLTARLAEFPDEKELLADALRLGIPAKILELAGSADYESHLASMSRALSKTARIEPELADDVVAAWAEALNRPVGYRKSVSPYPVHANQPVPDSEGQKAFITILIGLAGFFGAALGAGFAIGILLLTEVSVGDTAGLGPIRHKNMVETVALFTVIRMGFAGVAGALAAVFGWLMGRGERPWAGIAAAFGSGFSMAVILSCLTPLIITIVVIAGSVFGMTFRAASRDGHRI